jgi:hypothetical protein
MQYKTSVMVILLLCTAIAFAGCTTPAGTGSGSAGGSSSGSASATDNLVPSTTDVVPDQNVVTINIGEKDYLGNIPVTFEGGMGQIHVTKIEVTLYRSDGQVKIATIRTNKGESVDLEGTKQNDRVVVYISFDNGQRLKTNDVISSYRTRG